MRVVCTIEYVRLVQKSGPDDGAPSLENRRDVVLALHERKRCKCGPCIWPSGYSEFRPRLP